MPIWQAAAEILRHIDDTSNNSPSHININDETHHSEEYDDTSGGIRGLRKKKKKKKKNSMSRSKSHKSAKHPKAKEKKKNVFGNKDTTEEDDNNNTGAFVGDDEEEGDTGTIVGDEEEVVITCNGCTTCTDAILGATATATNDKGESESYTCKERIQFLMTSKGGSMSENAACTQVGKEFPTICGSCTPCCTQEQQVAAACEAIDDGNPCTTKTCIAVDDYFGFDCVPKKDTDGKLLPPIQYEYTCPTKNPVNPDGTCDNGVCVGKCSSEEVDFLCDQDGKDSCVTKACTKGEEDGATVCGNVVNKADGTACNSGPCKEGTCSSGVCTGMNMNKADGTTCQTNDQFNPEGTCFNGVCSGNCSDKDVAACDQDVNSCTTKACTKEGGTVVCGSKVVNKADGTTCKSSPCKEEGTCSNGVCTGGNDLAQGTKDKCGTADTVYGDPIECCNGVCCTKDKPFCCRYLLTNDYTW